MNLGVKQKNINEKFAQLTMRHRFLLDNAELLANAVSFVLIMQLLISCILICMIGKYNNKYYHIKNKHIAQVLGIKYLCLEIFYSVKIYFKTYSYIYVTCFI